jgi:preprotein translocase subunit YajC
MLFAPAGQADGRAMGVFALQMVLIIGIIYFLMIRPRSQQEKKHRERLAGLKRGDEIVTAGGIIGEIIHVKDDQITVKSGESRLVILRERIADVRAPRATEEATKS